MFNLQGSELIIILLLALVVLGPEKLPDAMRKLGNFYAQMKKMSTSFQQEFKAAVDEPMREVRETANMLRDSADFRKLSAGERTEKPKSAEMAGTTAALAAAAETASTETASTEAASTEAASTETAASDTAASDVVRPGTAPSSEPADAADPTPTPTATSTPPRDPFGGVSSASPRPTGRNGTAAGGPVDIPSPKPPAGPVVTGTPPVPGAAAPPPPPPPPPPGNGAASPGGDALPPLAPSEVEAE